MQPIHCKSSGEGTGAKKAAGIRYHCIPPLLQIADSNRPTPRPLQELFAQHLNLSLSGCNIAPRCHLAVVGYGRIFLFGILVGRAEHEIDI